MVDHILNIPRLVLGFGVKCLNWILQNHIYELIPRMEQKLYRSRHLIPMVIGTPCSIEIYFVIILKKKKQFQFEFEESKLRTCMKTNLKESQKTLIQL